MICDLSRVWRYATLVSPSTHNLIFSPDSMSNRGGLRPPRFTSPRRDERGEVYLWLHSAVFLLWRPPARRRLVPHLSIKWTLERSTASLLRYRNTQILHCRDVHKDKHSCHTFKQLNFSVFYPSL